MFLIANTFSGGMDLFNCCPDLKNAVITDVEYISDDYFYITELIITAENGLVHRMRIKQEK